MSSINLLFTFVVAQVSIDFEIPRGMTYMKTMPTFVQIRAKEREYGLSFISEQETDKVVECLKQAVEG
jgi:hypothetical protein